MSTNMKQYLELEPFICDILYKFNETSYSSCLALMSQFEPIFALDQYLASHLRRLYYEIRYRIIVIYFLPYKNGSMTVMARQLNRTIDIFEDEFVHLIRLGKIKARIDSKNKILYVADTDQPIIKANLSVKDDSISTSIRLSNNNNVSRRQFVSNVPGNIMNDG
ncbi:unnamed protein product [Rotaria sordida]|nr:unnamed protein product [Rotaria sordida]